MAEQVIRGADVLIKNIDRYGGGFIKAVNTDMKHAASILGLRIEKNISSTDHTLEDLRKMGHPYAGRDPNPPHKPEYIVHTQSGELLQGLFSGIKPASITGGELEAAAFAGISDEVEHATYVIFGTSKMIPRNFLIGSLGEVQEQIFKKLRRSLNKFTITFQGKKVKL